ncbi:MAG: 23S rRNA (pseudouridine(1915)-N(3))-methyltransferase RlmH [Pseudomonadota bacterium]
MKFTLCVVGRLRAGPERDLLDDYLSRFEKTGRALGLGPCRVVEVEDRKGGGKEAEGALLARAVPSGAVVCALDERGRVMTSPDFASQLGKWRDNGRSEVVFLIGGADGLAPDLVSSADLVLAYGAMVWPHMLARVMLAEQLYRAANILAGTPYHRS